MNGPCIRFAGTSKFYGDVLGVMGVNLTINPGVTGLLGPNGAGKSTLIKLASGLLCPDQGDVFIGDRSTWGNSRLGFQIGYLPDGDALPDFMTGRRFVSHLLRFHGEGVRSARQRAETVLERVDLSQAANRRIRTYSKGMRQRLKLAQALAHDPQVLILDEPLAGLDPVGRRDVMALIRQAGEKGRTVLVSSHILHEVEAMTDQVALMRHGRLIASGRIPELRSGLQKQPFRIRLHVDRSRRLAAMLMECEDVIGVHVPRATYLDLETHSPEKAIEFLTGIAARGEACIHELGVEDQGLEAVFRYTVDR